MALVKCLECGREVSDKAAACPNCGAPPPSADEAIAAPSDVRFGNGKFIGTRANIVALAIKAVQSVRYKLDGTNEEAGTVSFTTGMTMGSWSGVSGTIVLEEVAPFEFSVTGTGKQNVRGGQVVALDLFGESKAKVRKVVDEMQRLAKAAA